MATVAGVKIKTKVTKARGTAFADEKYTGGEPQWDTEQALKMEQSEFDHNLRKSFYYYNYYYSQKDCKKYVVDWMRLSGEFSKEEIKAFIRSNDKSLPMTACSLVMAHRKGMPLRPRHIEFLDEVILEAIKHTEPEVVEATASPAQKIVWRFQIHP